MTYKIDGGIPLRGEYQVSGSKNAAAKMLVAGLLTDEPVILKNVPRISDTEAIIEILHFLGVKADWTGANEVRVEARSLSGAAVPAALAKKFRASVLMLGALSARMGEAAVPDPGADKIHQRPIGRHIEALKQIGVEIRREGEFLHARGKPTGGTIEFPKNTHTGTENILLSSVLAKGEVIIKNAAEEPEIDDLISLLNAMGANVKRTKPREILVIGAENLHGAVAAVSGDRIEAFTAAAAAAITRGDILICGAPTDSLTAALSKLKEIGISYKVTDGTLQVWTDEKTAFKPVEIISRPYPGFLTDWLPLIAVLLTQADGESLLHEAIFPNRLQYINELKRMGAEIHLFRPEVPTPEDFYNFDAIDDRPEFPHAVKIFGPTPLHGTKVEVSDVRSGAALLLAALAARGQSELRGIEHIFRNFENLPQKLTTLGAKLGPADSL